MPLEETSHEWGNPARCPPATAQRSSARLATPGAASAWQLTRLRLFCSRVSAPP